MHEVTVGPIQLSSQRWWHTRQSVSADEVLGAVKIAIVCDTYPPNVNGAAIFAMRLSEGLHQRGHKVCVISPSPDGFSYFEDVGGIENYRIPSVRYPWHPDFRIADLRRVSCAVEGALDDFRPDVVHIQSHFFTGKRAAIKAKNDNIRLIATNHFMPDNLDSQTPFRLPRSIYRIAARGAWRELNNVFGLADVVTTPTPYAAELLESKTFGIRAIPVSCGIDISKYEYKRDRRKAMGRFKRILFVGRLDAEKRVGEIITALPKLSSDVELRIVGNGTLKQSLSKLSLSLDVGDRVHFLGHLQEGDLINEYASADVFCMPGRAELQSIATLEAMASGLPVVAAHAHALPELVQEGENGYLFEPGDVSKLALALQAVLDDDFTWDSFSKASRMRAERHAIANTLDAFEKLYQDPTSRHLQGL